MWAVLKVIQRHCLSISEAQVEVASVCGKLKSRKFLARLTLGEIQFNSLEKEKGKHVIRLFSSIFRPPSGCLQWFVDVEGSLQSFNFAGGNGHLINQDYSVCIRQEYGNAYISLSKEIWWITPPPISSRAIQEEMEESAKSMKLNLLIYVGFCCTRYRPCDAPDSFSLDTNGPAGSGTSLVDTLCKGDFIEIEGNSSFISRPLVLHLLWKEAWRSRFTNVLLRKSWQKRKSDEEWIDSSCLMLGLWPNVSEIIYFVLSACCYVQKCTLFYKSVPFFLIRDSAERGRSHLLSLCHYCV